MCKEKWFFGISVVRGSHFTHPLRGLSVWAFLCILKGYWGWCSLLRPQDYRRMHELKRKHALHVLAASQPPFLGNCFRSAKIATCGYSLSEYFAKCVVFFSTQNIVFPLFLLSTVCSWLPKWYLLWEAKLIKCTFISFQYCTESTKFCVFYHQGHKDGKRLFFSHE